MKLKILPLLCSLFFACGAAPKKEVVNVMLRNDSPHDLDWVEMKWKGPHVPGGILSKGIWSASVSTTWTYPTNGVLDFVDRKTRKPYQIELSLVELAKVNKQVSEATQSRNQILISILAYDKATVTYHDRSENLYK